jgi:hypothetical protein
MNRRLRSGCYAVMGLAALQGCVTQIEAPEAAITAAKQVCAKVLSTKKAPLAWRASLLDGIWDVSGDPNALFGYGVSVSIPRTGEKAPQCVETVMVHTDGRHGGNPPQP